MNKRNPFLESLIGGLGVGAGFAAGSAWVRGTTKNPFSVIRMPLDQAIDQVKAAGFKLLDNYANLETANRAAIIKEKEGHETKIISTTPFGKGGQTYPFWVLYKKRVRRSNPRPTKAARIRKTRR